MTVLGLNIKPLRPLDWVFVLGAMALGAAMSALIAWLTGHWNVLSSLALIAGFGFGPFAHSAGVSFGRTPRESIAFVVGLFAVGAITYVIWALFGPPA